MPGSLPSLFFGKHTIVRARWDERPNRLFCQRVLSSQIGLFCPKALSSEVPSSKVAVFRGLQSAGVKLFHLEGGNHFEYYNKHITQFDISSEDDIDYAMSLVKQVYKSFAE